MLDVIVTSTGDYPRWAAAKATAPRTHRAGRHGSSGRRAGVELLERERDLAVLAESVDRAWRSAGALVLVEGHAGMGKSSLLERCRELALQAGVRVLSGRSGDLEREFPYGVVRQLFEPALRDAGVRGRHELLAGGAELALPVLAVAGTGKRAAQGPADDPFAVVHGLYRLTANMAAREPLVILVDDVHWADSPSQRFLLYLARRLEGGAVTMVLAIRSGEPEARSDVLTRLARQPGAAALRPAALSERAVARLVQRGLREQPDESFVTACRDATGGTPFLVTELVAALAANGIRPTGASAARVGDLGPTTVAHAALLPLARLPGSTTALLRAVAVLGTDAQVDRAARLAMLTEAETLDAADALIAMRILRAGLALEFVHPIVRTAVYEDLPSAWRSAAHLRAARLLGADEADADTVVAHLLRTEPGEQPHVVEALRAGADAAMRRRAPEIAAVCLRRALAEAGVREARAGLLHELAIAETLMRDPGAAGHFEDAKRIERDPLRRARIARDLAELLVFSGPREPVPRRPESAVAADSSGRADELTPPIEGVRAGIAAFDPWAVADLDWRIPLLRTAAAGAGPASRELSLLLASLVAVRGGPPEEVLGLLERGLDDGRFLSDEGAESWALPQALGALTLIDELDRAAVLADDMVAHARKAGSRIGIASGLAHRALAQARRGNLVAAEVDLRDALGCSKERDPGVPLPATLWYGADAIIERRELADMATMAEALEAPAGSAPRFAEAVALEVRGRARLLAGDVGGAVGDLRACGQTVAALGFNNPNLSAWRSHLALALAGEESGEARVLAAAELADARRIGVARGVGVALRVTGLLTGGESGLAMLREAVSVLECSRARLEHARALVELGAALRRARQRAAARDPLRAGLDLAHRCGATRLAERARTELAATGARPRRLCVIGRDALTPSEHRIARMAAGGLSNREIARVLFVTAKTVENHLGRIYHKLGVNGRGALADALEREPSAPWQQPGVAH